jgi:hypothetical protein
MLGAGLGACGGVSSNGTNETDVGRAETAALAGSGERLTALGYQAGEAVQFRHFHDELLGFDCRFAADAAGVLRCFPQHGARVVYLDAACTQPAIRDHGVSRGEWVVESNSSCPGEMPTYAGVYAVGEQIYEAAIVGSEDYQVYERAGADCIVAAPGAKSNPSVHALVAKEASELVSGRIVSFETSGGLRVQRVVAEEGAEATLGVALADGTACTLQRRGICLAEQQVDSPCRVPATLVGASDAELKNIGQGPLHLEMYELRGVSADQTARTFRIPDGYTGTFLTPNGSCAVRDTADGSLRCVDESNEAVESGYFADASCQTRLYRAYAPDDQRLDAKQLANLRHIERGVEYRVESVSSLRPHSGDVYALTNSVCSVVSHGELVRSFTAGVPTLMVTDSMLPLASLPLVKNTRL